MDTRTDEWDDIIRDAASTELKGELPDGFAREILRRSRLREEEREPSSAVWWIGMTVLAMAFIVVHVAVSLQLYISLWGDLQHASANLRLDLVLLVGGALLVLQFLPERVGLERS